MSDEKETLHSDQAEPSDDKAQKTSSHDDDRFTRRWSKEPERKADPDPSESVVEDPTPELLKERARANDLYERLQRSMADLSNYRKRADAEREEMAKFASMLLVADLLPVLDDFDRALATLPTDLQRLTWLRGVVLIQRHLQAILEHQGVTAIEAVGRKFDPSFHEAVVEEPNAEAEPGTIIADLQTGYIMHGQVIRPTLAKVATAPVTEDVAPINDESEDSFEDQRGDPPSTHDGDT